MPFSFFNKYEAKDPEELISHSKAILLKHDRHKTTIELVNSRIAEFKAEILSQEGDKKQVKAQYLRFASTLHLCVTKPQYTDLYTNEYINSPYYYPVGIKEKRLPDPSEHKLFSNMLKLSLFLILGSIPLFFIKPVIGAVALAVGVLLLVPCALYFLSPTPLNIAGKQDEDRGILTAVGLIMSEPEIPLAKEKIEDTLQSLYPSLSSTSF